MTADGEPIADARIEIDYLRGSEPDDDVASTETKAGTTDADGTFTLQVSDGCGLPGSADDLKRSIRVSGTPYTVGDVEADGSSVTVTANEYRYRIEVVDEAGRPVADVDAAYSLRLWGATVPFEVAGTEAVIEAVPAGTIYVAIVADGCTFRTTAGAAGEDGRYVVEAKEGVGVDATFVFVPEPTKLIRVYQRADVDDSLASIEEGVPMTAGTVEWEVFADDDRFNPVRYGSSPIGADGYAVIPAEADRVHFSIDGYEVRGYYALDGVEGGKVNGYPAVADSAAGWYELGEVEEFGAWREGDAPAVFKVKFSVDGAAFSTDDGVPVGSMINDCLFEEGARFGFVLSSDGQFNKIGFVTDVGNKEGPAISDNCIPFAYTTYSFERWCVNGEDMGNLHQIVVGYDDAENGIVYVSATFSATETVLADGAGYEPAPSEPVSVAIEVAGGYVYNGREQSVSFTVTVDGAAVPRDRLIVSGDVGTGAGEYTLEAKSAGADFPGAVSAEWSIAPKALSPSMIRLLGGVPQCDGTVKHVQFCVSDGAAVLERGRDFAVVSGEAGVDSGDYALIVEGVGNYAGKALAIWRIAPAPAPAASAGLSDPTAAFIAAAGLVALAAMAFAAVRLRRR